MIENLTWLVSCTAAGALGVWWCQRFAVKSDWLDHPNERSFHENPTPRIGGIGMLFPVLLTVLVILILPTRGAGLGVLATLGPAFLVAVLSFFDDRMELSRLIRFGGHALCAAIVLFALRGAWVGQALPVLGASWPVLICAILLMIWITGLTNAYNFMDGIDGISAIQGIVAVAGWISIFLIDPLFWNAGNSSQLLILLALTGGLLGFLLLNWAPASIFIGDIGSTFLGFYLAVIPFAFAASGMPLTRTLEAGVFFVWPFVMDASVTFTRRLIKRERIFDAHRSHLYQVLASTFPTRDHGHRMTSLLFGLLALVGVGLYWSSGPLWAKLAVLGGLWVAVTAWTYGIRASTPTGDADSGSTLSGSPFVNKTFLSEQMPYDIFLSPPEITSVEHERVAEALSSGFIAPVGPQVDQFESGLATYLGMEEVQAVNSGTAAIHLGLRSCGVGPGDCVLCPDLTFVASVNPVRYLGGEPVLVDVNPDNWAMDPEIAREAIRTLKSEGRTVRAMVVVHAFGIPAPMDELVQVARDEGIALFEDCAGAFGSRIGEQSVGLFGDAAAFSFNGNKVLTTSGGGALYVRDASKRGMARIWANQGKDPNALGYSHETMGYNYRLSNICAAIGLGQLETVDQRLARKEFIYQGYRERFSGVSSIGFMPEPEYGKGNYWLSNISIDNGAVTAIEQFVMALRSARIEASTMWRPMALQGVNDGLRRFGGTASQEIFRTFLSLPSGSALSGQDLDRVADTVKEQLQVAT